LTVGRGMPRRQAVCHPILRRFPRRLMSTPKNPFTSPATVSQPQKTPLPGQPTPRRGFWNSFGPAIITASVVLGPGSILTASKTGMANGYAMVWVLALAVLLMISVTALSARLGVLLEGTLCEEIANRVGRGAAIVTGGTLFLICA